MSVWEETCVSLPVLRRFLRCAPTVCQGLGLEEGPGSSSPSVGVGSVATTSENVREEFMMLFSSEDVVVWEVRPTGGGGGAG